MNLAERKKREGQRILEAQFLLTVNQHLRGYLASLPHPLDAAGKHHSHDWNLCSYYDYVMQKGSHSKKLRIARSILKLPIAHYDISERKEK